MFIDKEFKPLSSEFIKFEQEVKASGKSQKAAFCLERNDGLKTRFDFEIFADGVDDERNYRIAERIFKSMLWIAGGYKLYVSAGKYVENRLVDEYRYGGAREFDADFMAGIYEAKFEVVPTEYKKVPKANEKAQKIGGQLKGCRIGFDAGGSDRKVSAVVDGKVIWSDETVWNPKLNSDPKYHFDGIMDSMKRAAEKMPRVDAIGVSSAGVYINNRAMAASLFIKVGKEDFDKHCKDIYLNCAKEFGNVPIVVANDGDVTALAGAMEFGVNNILGIAMGTSEAAGYINSKGRINGWLNELAFVPVDLNDTAMVDEWSGDKGCGVKYFSQDGVIKLAEMNGFKFEDGLSPAEKLKVIQGLLEKDDECAIKIFENIGYYLGYAIAWYSNFYAIDNLMILGRVTSGKASDLIVDNAKKVLKEEYKKLADIKFLFPDEKNKRVGQSIAAASLPNC